LCAGLYAYARPNEEDKNTDSKRWKHGFIVDLKGDTIPLSARSRSQTFSTSITTTSANLISKQKKRGEFVFGCYPLLRRGQGEVVFSLFIYIFQITN
jgi:hypothetical protein